MKTIQLNNSVSIPVLGFGTWQLTGEDCLKSVQLALKTGYLHIDTADKYGNHREVGKAILQSNISRDEIHLTTKVWRTDLAKDAVSASCDRFLQELQTDYIDLLLIHWPNKTIPITETLEAMNKLKESGKIRAIGVSNFTKHHLEDALKTGIKITNNQIEIHPSFKQEEMKTFCDEKGIALTAYSPLGRGQDIALPVIQEIAQKHNTNPAQVILAWLLNRGIIAIPKSDKQEEIESNFKAPELVLSKEDIEAINATPQGPRLVNPEFAEWDY
ncbi:MAG: aldo/keto reductase [Candidatus Wildermuthbacteria bacterium]|nr:aldo/keto reductase [Candidatus Wildermuthbacteria bacterium]